ncbi:glyceraldehyde-3-phosphate dehydrogenase [Dissulfurirhabdus thermomarina]|uniref:Glyceraldehyde-3-phosphate dehydrogenase n=1 Tax=Dissulfurirhabdus thermomarina TaxID=1765737 RepID=A0A6N9TQL7_DISTH|nr:glyceraldehyde 3-phosphate dehydrogenase NAD-binding domain-containing protein [Dissulfurirhabdus thermomarina]NDY41737.1 glyceraldehyde-3-phosphate dehydrogenase [Dissulfurirhabdus thermomarina]NMX23673.1 glyceraldehyde-3-phosphate dehydrogenase [Dissulfurirhabdus thermomarina]
MKLGINGLGRIGKLSLWHHVGRRYFSEIVVNLGRQVGQGLHDIAACIEKDSTYGHLGAYLHGHRCPRVVEELDEAKGTMKVDGIPVTILRESRNPADIAWKAHGVRLVVDSTGVFTDPTAPPDSPKGALRGHLEAGAEKVILSAPFKIKDKTAPMPEDAVTTVMGINGDDYRPDKHRLISAASCTTTCLAHMVKPLLDHFGVDRILSASMVTVHAATGSQPVLDRLPKTGATDLRKNRSILNNIVLTTTGAARALALVLPEMKKIGFIAESVRIPTSTGSLIVLVLTIQDQSVEAPINRDLVNGLYRKAAEGYARDYLVYTEEQNVSADIVGVPAAAAVIEARETHTRTGIINVDPKSLCAGSAEAIEALSCATLQVPVTQVVVYGWYDNELGSYTNMLGERTVTVADSLL